jgi:hypothetical protein
VNIKVFPQGDLEGTAERTVRFALKASKDYVIKAPHKVAEVEILKGK